MVRAVIQAEFDVLAEQLEREERLWVSKNLPMDLFEFELDNEDLDTIKLCRLFILKRGCALGKEENHVNSTQYLFSYYGEGEIVQCALQQSRKLTFCTQKGDLESINRCWDKVEKNTWHFPVAGGLDNWYTIAFHTEKMEDIIECYR